VVLLSALSFFRWPEIRPCAIQQAAEGPADAGKTGSRGFCIAVPFPGRACMRAGVRCRSDSGTGFLLFLHLHCHLISPLLPSREYITRFFSYNGNPVPETVPRTGDTVSWVSSVHSRPGIPMRCLVTQRFASRGIAVKPCPVPGIRKDSSACFAAFCLPAEHTGSSWIRSDV